ncbi:LysR family transcriptional regulator [Thalassococcus sp. BH17M4-6]|uniref:LysR family transcriptional regulator n=1 Tax=Thalassococcus sp. BH17M4-6 TaxID=3413148 RepID=UPI003BCEA823
MKSLNLDQLGTFLAVLRHGGVNRAATVLNLSQPAVTARIKNLEAALGRTLFERTPKGLLPTREAELLAGHAERFELLASLVERDMVDAAAHRGLLRIGASETVTQTWLPDFILRLHRELPAITVDINVDISPNLRDGLLTREIDLAFLLGPVSEPTVENLDLPAFELAWYVSSEHAARIAPDALLSLPVVTYVRQTRPYRELRQRLIEAVGPSARIFTSSSLSAIFRLVESGIGVAALPRAMSRTALAQGRIVEFDPGWRPKPLLFTASWIGEPPDPLAEKAARIAQEVAETAAL